MFGKAMRKYPTAEIESQKESCKIIPKAAYQAEAERALASVVLGWWPARRYLAASLGSRGLTPLCSGGAMLWRAAWSRCDRATGDTPSSSAGLDVDAAA